MTPEAKHWSEMAKSEKQYPLRIEFYGELEAFYSKGHAHQPESFLAAVRGALEYEGMDEEIAASLDTSMIVYRWFRKRPALPDERVHGYDYWVEDAKPGSRGAFPAMEVYVG